MKNDRIALSNKILELRKKRRALILSHNYQLPEIQNIADHRGDSLGLSRIAADTDCNVIVFCGVHFMAESASILSPDKTVLLPELKAGCPMADMITADELRDEKKRLGDDITVVCYVNTSADVKAESDICCTSANAIQVLKSLDPNKRVLMIPDMHLAEYAAKKANHPNVIPYPGYCPTHHRLKRSDLEKMIEKYPEAEVLVHPECPFDVVELADQILSTSGMLEYAKKSKSKSFIIGTEAGLLYSLKKQNPDKKFYLASKFLLCPNMKRTTLDSVLRSLEENINIIKVPEEIRIPAKKALDKMLQIPRD
ncbi:quinolinate synthase NadA [bacterium]|nr:quinolinate synthase NadA [bacterium]